MSKSQVNGAQLRKRDPEAWTALLQNDPALRDVQVTAVATEKLPHHPAGIEGRAVLRYLLTLAGHSDPAPFIGKYTNRREVQFYRHLAPQLTHLTPRCWFSHVFNDDGWIVLSDVPNHTPPAQWNKEDANLVIADLAALHTQFLEDEDNLETAEIPHFLEGKTYTLTQLRSQHAVLFEEGPASILSEHAIHHAQRLAPQLLQAANGLTVLRDLGGWPGILGESHLTAVADLLDDPVPMLQPLRNLPTTLLHNDPHAHHWRLTLFGSRRLIDWQYAVGGPGILDLVAFLEQFDLLYERDAPQILTLRESWPASEETLVDTYLLERYANADDFNTRAARQALAAARCLYVITHWFPTFAEWASDMPHKYVWQRVNRMSTSQLVDTEYWPMVRLRPYLSRVFQRFLHAYRTL